MRTKKTLFVVCIEYLNNLRIILGGEKSGIIPISQTPESLRRAVREYEDEVLKKNGIIVLGLIRPRRMKRWLGNN